MATDSDKRAVGVFHDYQETEQALQDLKSSSFPMEQVSVVAKQSEENDQLSGANMSDRIGTSNVKAPKGIVADIAAGSFWGSILVGLTSLAIPGAGPVLAAGAAGVALVSGVTGVGIGAAETRGLVKALENLGIPGQQASTYSDRLIRGDYLVIVDGSSNDIDRAQEIFSNRGIREWGVYSPSNG